MLAACARDKPVPAASLAVVDAAPPPAPAISRFSVPLDYDFTSVLKIVEQVVPTTFGSLDSVRTLGDDPRKHYAFEAKRGRFTAFAEGDRLHLRTTLTYGARGYYKPPVGPTLSAGCGGEGSEQQPRLVVELATPITLTDDWHLASHASIARVEAASSRPRDHCDVSFLHLDVTDRVVEAARGALASRLRDIDRRIAKVDLTEQAQGWWALLGRPIQLTEGVWLELNPEKLRIGEVAGERRVLTVPVSLEARPLIVSALSSPPVSVKPLPHLEHDSIAEGFQLSFDGVIAYATASHAISEAVGRRTIERSGHSATVRGVTVLPVAKGRLALVVEFTGDANGTLRFAGTPRYDAIRREVSVPDLDYELETDNKFLNTYAWIKSDAMREDFRQHARFPAAQVLERGRGLLLEGLNRKIGDVLTLSATVDSVAVQGIYVTRGGLVLRANASGHASVAVKQQ